jgi:hypothetical protein
MQHEHAAWKCSMAMQHGYAELDMQHRHAAWACSVGMNAHMDMRKLCIDMEHRDMDMQHGQAARISSKNMQHVLYM